MKINKSESVKGVKNRLPNTNKSKITCVMTTIYAIGTISRLNPVWLFLKNLL
jgi:hypothetical protein